MSFTRRVFLLSTSLAAVSTTLATDIPSRFLGTTATSTLAGQETKPKETIFRIGIIGATTSHVPAAVNLFNSGRDPFKNKEDNELLKRFRVTAVYPGGVPGNAASWERRDRFTTICIKAGAQVYSSVEELVQNVDGVLLESVDGRVHLEQAKPVLAAKKPMFIDKPIAGSLADTLEIFQLAQEYGVPVFSSSTLRFNADSLAARKGDLVGKVLGCETYSPSSSGRDMPDYYFYAIHGIETLFVLMGPNCKSVSRIKTSAGDVTIGCWDDDALVSSADSREVKAASVLRFTAQKESRLVVSMTDTIPCFLKLPNSFFQVNRLLNQKRPWLCSLL